MSETVKYLYLSTSQRINGFSNSCLIRTTTQFDNVKKVSVSTVSIPNTIYSVTEYFHMPLQENGGPIINVVIPREYYTPATMATAIAAALTAGGSLTYTVTYDSDTNKFTITSTGVFGFAWSTDKDLYPFNEAYVTLGFQNNLSGTACPDDQDSSASNTQISSGQVLFQSKYLFVNVSPLSNGSLISGDGQQSALAIVPVDRNSTDIIVWNENSYYSQEAMFTNQSVGGFYLNLSYSDGSLVDLNNADWAIMVKLTF